MKRSFADFEDKAKVDAWSDRNSLRPTQVSICALKKVWFTCPDTTCGHDFQKYLSHVTQGGWCPFCTNHTICTNIDCNVCIPKTFFGYHDKAKVKSWSDRNTQKPWEVFKGSKKDAWFLCDNCDRDFCVAPVQVTHYGQWCPCCFSKRICSNSKECLKCIPKTFYAFEDKNKVSSWSERNVPRPWNISISNGGKFWFDCNVCHHSFEMRISLVTRERRHWCPYCSNQKLCEDARECESCLSKTFNSYPEKIKVDVWSVKNKLRPWEVFMKSGVKVWFHCEPCGRAFERSPVEIVLKRLWCPHCPGIRNHAMEKLVEIFNKLSIVYSPEKKITLDGRRLRWDATCQLKGVDVCVESDGPQHFSAHGVTEVSRGKVKGAKAIAKFQDQRARDLLKEKHIRDNGLLLFRFSYRQTAQIESLVAKMLEHVEKKTKGVIYMDSIYWNT